MKVLLINGSPHKNGSTFHALRIVENALIEEGIETEIFHIGSGPVQGCTGCMYCKNHPGSPCVIKDRVSECSEKILAADGVILGAPCYFGGPNGAFTAFLDRAFYPINERLHHKLGASVTTLRRAGATATLNRLNLYFTNTMMHIVSSSYWPMLHGFVPEEQQEDKEGLEVLAVLGKNMAWMLKCISASGIPAPQYSNRTRTSFVREAEKPSYYKV